MLLRVMVGSACADTRDRLSRVVRALDLPVRVVSSHGVLDRELKRAPCDLVLLDPDLAPAEGGVARVIERLRQGPDHPEVVLFGEDIDPRRRAALVAAGSYSMLARSLSDGALTEALRTLTGRLDETRSNRALSLALSPSSQLEDFATESEPMRELLRTARKVARADTTVLIVGETGVGKEWLARAIHGAGPRGTQPLVAVNCAAMTETLLDSELFGHEEGAFTGAVRARRGHFEMAHGGTLLLDEIAELPAHLQVKLLRVLQERQVQRVGGEEPIDVNVRVMAATNRNLSAEIEAGRFRTDLYYRLSVVRLAVPPLRERVEDLPTLCRSHLDRFNRQLGRSIEGFEPAVLDALLAYPWPGNVRELINVLERAVLLCDGDRIVLEDLPEEIGSCIPPVVRPGSPGEGPPGASGAHEAASFAEARREAVDAFERRYLEDLLLRAQGRVGDAARLARLDPRSLYAKLRRHGLRKEDFKG